MPVYAFFEVIVVILTSVGLISADMVAHMPLHRRRVGCVTASAAEASLAEKNQTRPWMLRTRVGCVVRRRRGGALSTDDRLHQSCGRKAPYGGRVVVRGWRRGGTGPRELAPQDPRSAERPLSTNDNRIQLLCICILLYRKAPTATSGITATTPIRGECGSIP